MIDEWSEEIAVGAKSAVATAREVFVAWEKYRLIYNLVLVCETLLLGMPHWRDPFFWVYVFSCALGANLLFCLGIWAEGYADLVGMKRESARIGLFVLGMVIATGGTLFAILAYGFNKMG